MHLKTPALFFAAVVAAFALTSPPRTEYVTYLGGSYGEGVVGTAVDASGSQYVAGNTNSPDFPLTSTALGAPSATNNCSFVTKLNPASTGILFSVCVANSHALAFGLDASGNIYLTAQQFRPFFTYYAVLKLDPSGQKILNSMVIEGMPEAMAVDALGNVYLAGSADTSLNTTPGAYQRQLSPGICHAGAGVGMTQVPCTDAYVMKLKTTGEVAWATFLGGSGPDAAHTITIDSAGNVWVAGETVSPDFPLTSGAYQRTFHGEVDLGPLRYGDAFIAKLDPTGGKLLYSTYLGGDAPDGAFGMTVDAMDSVYVTGGTQSTNFPTTPGAVQTNYAGSGLQIPSLQGNAFIAKLSSSGSVIYSSFAGGANTRGTAIVADAAGQAFIKSVPPSAASQAPTCAGRPAVSVLNATGTSVIASSTVGGDYLALDSKGGLYSAGQTRTLLFLSTPRAYQTQYGGGDSDAFAAKVDFTQPAGIAVSTVVNAASFSPGPNGAVAPGEIISIFGDGFGTQATVDFSGLPAPVLYASNCQINAVVPLGAQALVSTFLTVQSGSQALGPIKLPVAAAQPGIFTLDGTGHGQAAVINQDGTINSASHPATRGSIIAVYMTGTGASTTIQSLTGAIGLIAAKTVFAGQAPGLAAGVTQVNVEIPQNAPTGESVPITLSAAGVLTQVNPPVTVAVQ